MGVGWGSRYERRGREVGGGRIGWSKHGNSLHFISSAVHFLKLPKKSPHPTPNLRPPTTQSDPLRPRDPSPHPSTPTRPPFRPGIAIVVADVSGCRGGGSLTRRLWPGGYLQKAPSWGRWAWVVPQGGCAGACNGVALGALALAWPLRGVRAGGSTPK